MRLPEIQTGRNGLGMSSTNGKIFFDTNVLVYAADGHAPEKQRIARDLLRTSAEDNSGVISTQVLQEFYVVATRKLGMEPAIAKDLLLHFENLEVVQVTTAIIRDAVDTSVSNRVSFWDGLIIECAAAAACAQLLTEDLNDGQSIRSVRIENPFLR